MQSIKKPSPAPANFENRGSDHAAPRLIKLARRVLHEGGAKGRQSLAALSGRRAVPILKPTGPTFISGQATAVTCERDEVGFGRIETSLFLHTYYNARAGNSTKVILGGWFRGNGRVAPLESAALQALIAVVEGQQPGGSRLKTLRITHAPGGWEPPSHITATHQAANLSPNFESARGGPVSRDCNMRISWGILMNKVFP